VKRYVERPIEYNVIIEEKLGGVNSEE